MNLASTISLSAGGPGSGCRGPNCGPGSGSKPGVFHVVRDYKGDFHVHKDGCRDATKAVSQGGWSEGKYSAESASNAVDKYLNELDQSHGGKGASGYTSEDVKVHGCTKK